MRNAAISWLRSQQLDLPAGEIRGMMFARHLDLWLAASPTTLFFVRNGCCEDEVFWLEGEEPSDLISLDLIESCRAVAIFSSGLLVSVDIETKERDAVSLSVPSPLLAASWHPSHSLLAVVNVDHAIFIIDSLYDVVADNFLETTENGMDELVTVGWGSETTQFQGAAGKAAREKKEEFVAAEEDEEEGLSMEWRADGHYCIVSFRPEEGGSRVCTTWDASCRLLSRVLRSRPLGPFFSPRPVGNSIAISSTGKIVFAERNGELRNGIIEYKSRCPGMLRGLSWNCSGSLLALRLRSPDNQNYLQIWMCNNMEWVCKMSLPFPHAICLWRWDEEEEDVLHIFTPTSELLTLRITLLCNSAEGICLTVGRDCLGVTDFSRVVVPPPMAEVSLPIPRPLQAISLSPTAVSVIDHDENLHCWIRSPGRKLTFSSKPSIPIGLPSGSIVTGICVSDDGRTAIGFTFCADHGKRQYEVIVVDVDGKELSRCTVSDAVFWLRLKDSGQPLWTLNESTLKESVSPKNDIVLSLSRDGVLDKCGEVITKGVSSFSIHSDYLVWIDMEMNLHARDLSSGEDTQSRKVEKGARVIAVAPPKIILQMPRGNLETVHHRFFTIRVVREMIQKGEIAKALLEMKKHRIDMKLLYQYARESLENPSSWVSSIEDPDLLVLLLTNLGSDPHLSSMRDSMVECVLSLPLPHRLRLFPALVSALLTKSPPEPERALSAIRDNLPRGEDRAVYLREWVHVASYFLSSRSLFHSALATYDLPFSVEVMEILSIDPNEYMDTLNDLNDMKDEIDRRYGIDCLREDWNSALRCLSLQPHRLEEAKKLVIEKKLHPWALEVYADSPLLSQIAALCLDECERKGEWADAVIISRISLFPHRQLTAAEKAHDMESWLEALSLCLFSEEKRNEVMDNMKDKLKRDRRWNLLHRLLASTGAPWKECLDAAGRAREWREVADIGRREGSEAEGDARLLAEERAKNLRDEAGVTMEKINIFASRLRTVREEKKEKLEKIRKGEMQWADLDRGDAFSENACRVESSIASSRTGRSRSSRASTLSRRTKKIEKKKQSLKEGGEWEDAAILIAIHKEWDTLRNALRETGSLLPCLVSLRLFSSARFLSSRISRLEHEMTIVSSSVWPSHLSPHLLPGPLINSETGEATWSFQDEGPIAIPIDQEMLPPQPLTREEREWRVRLFT